MIGGSGEKKTLRLVAQYGDACNFFVGSASGADTVRAKLDALAGHGERVGTDYSRLRKTILWTAPVDPTTVAGGDAFAERMKLYADIGIVEVHVMPFNDPIAFIQGLGENVIPAVSDL